MTPTPTSTPKTLSYSDKKNCSPKSYEYINKRDVAREKQITLFEHNELQTRAVDFFLAHEEDLHKCYQDFTKAGHTEEYSVCIAVGVNTKSKVDFAEASDETNGLDKGIKSCLEKKLLSYDYKNFKAKHGAKFILPLKLTEKK
jgi:hypothetical protein